MNRDELLEAIRSSTNVIPEDEYRALFTGVAQVVSDIVAKTLGPYGSTTIIDDGTGFSYPTKDGWSCMSRLRFNDPIYQTIFNIIKQVSFNSVSTVGDGTTTAMVATSAFLNHLFKDVYPKMKVERQAEFIERMKRAAKTITEELSRNENVHHIDKSGDFSDIYRIANIATNGNEEFSKMLQDIYTNTQNPNIRIEIDGGAGETAYEIEHGYRFDCSVIDFMDYRNADNDQIKIDTRSQVIVFDHNVTYSMHKDIIRVLSSIAQQNNTNMIMMAPYFDDIVTSSITQQVNEMIRRKVYPNIMLVQIPTVSKLHQQSLIDLTVITGALTCTQTDMKAFNAMLYNGSVPEEERIELDLLSSTQYQKYGNTGAVALISDLLGNANKMVYTRNTGYIQDYDDCCNKDKYEKMLYECKESYEAAVKKASKTINGTLDKDFLFIQNRYIRLMGNNAIIRVGGASDIQRRCDKDSLDDAILACKSAFEYGYVRGLNLEVIHICNDLLDDLKYDNNPNNPDETCIQLYRDAFVDTLSTVLNNKNRDGKNDYSSLIKACLDTNSVYNLVTEKYEPENQWTVINSVQTDIEIINAMTSILTTIMTSSQFLSMLRNGDQALSYQKELEKRLKEEELIAKAKGKGLKASEALKDINVSNWNLGTYPTPITTPNVPDPNSPFGPSITWEFKQPYWSAEVPCGVSSTYTKGYFTDFITAAQQYESKMAEASTKISVADDYTPGSEQNKKFSGGAD